MRIFDSLDIIKFDLNKFLMQKQQIYWICPDHQEPLNYICLNQNCAHPGLICSFCQYLSHNHPLLSIGQILLQLKKDQQETCLPLLAQIDYIYSQLEKECQQLKNQKQRIKILEMITIFYKSQILKITQIKELGKEIVTEYQQIEKEEWNRLIMKQGFCERDLKTNKIVVKNQQALIRNILEQFEVNLKQFRESIKKQQSVLQMMQIFQLSNKKEKYYFSVEKKHSDFIVESKKTISVKNTPIYKNILVDPPFKKCHLHNFKTKSCSFHITSLSCTVAFGICYYNKESQKYSFSPSSRHGCCLIISKGRTYNNCNSNLSTLNSQSWTFGVGERITVKVEPKLKKVIFSKINALPVEVMYQDREELEMNFTVMVSGSADIQIV